MFFLKQNIVAILIVLLFSVPSSSSQIYGVAKYSFDLKSKPSIDGSVIKNIYKGEKLSLIERQGNWIKASTGNYKGWLASTWIDIHGDVFELPALEIPAIKDSIPGVIFKSFNPPIYGNARFRVFAREGASVKSPSSMMLRKGERVIVLGLQDNYLKIKNDKGEIAWIFSNLIDLTKNNYKSRSVKKKYKQDKIDSEINKLKLKFQDIPETQWRGRLDVLNEIKKFDPDNDRINKLIGEYSNKILKEKIQILEAKVLPLPSSDISGNLSLYSKLLELDPNNEFYQKKIQHYTKKKEELIQLQKERQRLQEELRNDKTDELIEEYSDELLAEQIQSLEAKVDQIPTSDISGNLSIYSKLLKLDPKKKHYQVKVEDYTLKLEELVKLQKERRRIQKEQAAKKETRNRQKREISDIEILDWNWRQSSSHYITARGMIRNVSGKRLEYVKALVTWTTNDGTYIIHNSSYVEYTSLLPNQESPFEVMVKYNPLMHSASLSFSVGGKKLAAFNREK